ncbi:PREDICTED: uncharacterized protein LOC109164358 [Ipomoea nil]|uniref:uncharacterized protein LOC109164358 n=1 Tax=Ipomoea nil TaxID=35883 RepID=UPI00090128E4|nr:PREDICTED: uncharacterized protein LOC109164358 [Ipomoea nil]
MKFSSSSSSSAAAAAGGGGCNAAASKNADPGCIAGMFRRLLCSNALPTHPADHVSSVSTHPSDHAVQKNQRIKLEEGKNSKKIESLASTGVVARLMGLESMPRVELNPNKAIARSQSMNSMDSLRELKSTKEKNLRACSFREIPTYLELEDENFFILSFEYGGKQRRSENEKKTRKTEKVKNGRRESVHQNNKENQDINQVSDKNLNASEIITGSHGKLQDSTNILRPTRKDASKKKDEYKQERFKKKKKKDRRDAKKIEADCDSEKSSPNSVLGFLEFPAIQDIPSSEKFSKLASSKSRRTLSEELENYRKLKLISDDFQPKRSEKVMNWGCSRDENDVKLWGEICRLADAETLQNKWHHEEIWKQEKVCSQEIIGGSFEFQILDELIGEMVDQLIIDSHIDSLCNLT